MPALQLMQGVAGLASASVVPLPHTRQAPVQFTGEYWPAVQFTHGVVGLESKSVAPAGHVAQGPEKLVGS